MDRATPAAGEIVPAPATGVSARPAPGARLLLLLVLCFAVVLRIDDIRWCMEGAETFTHSLHSDENRKVEEAFGLSLAPGGLRPSEWLMGKGTLLPLLGRSFFALVNRTPLRLVFRAVSGRDPRSIEGRYLLLRSISAACSLLLLWLVFRFAFQLSGNGYAGAFAAFLLATSFGSAFSAVIFKSDMLLATLVAAVLVAAAGYTRQPTAGRAVLQGVLLGAAVAAKYLGALAAVVPMTAILITPLAGWRRRVAHLGLCGLAGLAALFLASPYMFLDFPLLLRALRNTAQYGTTPIHWFEGFGFGPKAVLVHLLVPGLGPLLTAGALAGVGYALFRTLARGEHRLYLPALVFVVVVYAAQSMNAWLVVRYTLPLYPALTAFAGIATWRALETLWQRRSALARLGAASVVLLVVVHTVRFLAFNRLIGEPVTTVRAAHWLRGALPESCSVLEIRRRGPQVYGFGRDPVPGLTAAWVNKLVTEGGRLSGLDADYLIVTEQAFRDYFRLRDDRYRAFRLFFAELFDADRFERVATFTVTPRFLGIAFDKGTLPEDLLLISPDIHVFRRRGPGSGPSCAAVP